MARKSNNDELTTDSPEMVAACLACVVPVCDNKDARCGWRVFQAEYWQKANPLRKPSQGSADRNAYKRRKYAEAKEVRKNGVDDSY